jgi:anti-sigma factor (TIGR02949 family)
VAVPGRLTCDQALGYLADYLDHELGAAESRRVEAHLADCEACARGYRFQASMLEAIRRKVRQADVPPDLLSRILRRVASDETLPN